MESFGRLPCHGQEDPRHNGGTCGEEKAVTEVRPQGSPKWPKCPKALRRRFGSFRSFRRLVRGELAGHGRSRSFRPFRSFWRAGVGNGRWHRVHRVTADGLPAPPGARYNATRRRVRGCRTQRTAGGSKAATRTDCLGDGGARIPATTYRPKSCQDFVEGTFCSSLAEMMA